MKIEELITDLRARVNPQYYDQIGTESYERHQCVLALESLLARIDVLREENERQRFDILAMNQSLEMMREENERLRENAKTIGELEQLATRSNNNLLVENERLAGDMSRCYHMLLSEPDVKGALFKAENILRESLADRVKK